MSTFKNNPITIRVPDNLRKEIDAYLLQTDRTASRFIRAAIVEKLQRERVRASPQPTP